MRFPLEIPIIVFSFDSINSNISDLSFIYELHFLVGYNGLAALCFGAELKAQKLQIYTSIRLSQTPYKV